MAKSNLMVFLIDNFQGVTEIAFYYLPKQSRANIVTKENLIKFFWRSKILLI